MYINFLQPFVWIATSVPQKYDQCAFLTVTETVLQVRDSRYGHGSDKRIY